MHSACGFAEKSGKMQVAPVPAWEAIISTAAPMCVPVSPAVLCLAGGVV